MEIENNATENILKEKLLIFRGQFFLYLDVDLYKLAKNENPLFDQLFMCAIIAKKTF